MADQPIYDFSTWKGAGAQPSLLPPTILTKPEEEDIVDPAIPAESLLVSGGNAAKSVAMQTAAGLAKGLGEVATSLATGIDELTGYALQPGVIGAVLSGESSYDDAVADVKATRGEIHRMMEPNGGVVESIAKSISEFLTYALPVGVALNAAGAGARVAGALGMQQGKAATTLGTLAEAELAALYAENAAFAPDETRLSNLVQSVPALQNPITEYLQAVPGDVGAGAVFRQNLEALSLGALTAPLFYAVSSLQRAGGKLDVGKVDSNPVPSKQATEGADKVVEDIALGRGAEPKLTDPDTWLFGEGTFDARIAQMQNGNYVLSGMGPVQDTAYRTLDEAQTAYRQQREMVLRVIDAEKLYGRTPKAVQSVLDDKMLELQWRVRNGESGATAELEYRTLAATLDPEEAAVSGPVREQLVERIKNPPNKLPDPGETSGDNVLAWYEAQEQQLAAQGKFSAQKLLRKTEELVVDHAGAVKARLLADGGEAGKDAVMRFELAAGSSPASDRIFRRWRDEIYSKLNGGRGYMPRGDIRNLNQIIRLLREREIAVSNPLATARFQGQALKAKGFVDSLMTIRSKVGEAKYASLVKRANRYFDAMREQLTDLHKHGLIADDELAAMSRFNYQPRQFVQEIDPPTDYKFGKTKISVSSSGIEALGKGTEKLLETDSGMLLAQVVSRVQSRIARNEATRALGFVDEIPGVLSKERFADSVGLSYMQGGKRDTVYMSDELAEQWVRSGQVGGHQMAAILGVPLTRMFATGVNPEFALVQLPRDLAYIYMTTNQYNSFAPIAFAQMARDVATVGKDAALRRGRYEDYINEGGGMSFLTHGARTHTNPGVATGFEKVQATLGYINESSEIITRLMLRERAIRNGMGPEEATWQARRYIDFSQGGRAVKQLDVFIPYLNASVQGLRGLVRAAKERPLETGAKLGQFASLVGLHWMHNEMQHPEVMREISIEQKGRYFHFPTGLKYRDKTGNEIHLTGRVAVDHSLIPVKSTVESLMAWQLKGTPPTREMVEGIKQGWSIVGDVGQLLPGWAGALAQYHANWDFYTGDPIWKGPEVRPQDEVRRFPGRATSDLAVDITSTLAETTGIQLSPHRLESVVGDVIPNNVWSTAINRTYSSIRATPEYSLAAEESTEEYLARFPGLRRVLGRTFPIARHEAAWEQLDQQYTGEELRLNQEADKLAVLAYRRGRGNLRGPDMAAMRTLVKNAPPTERERLLARFQEQVFVMKTVDALSDPAFMEAKNPTWWFAVGSLEPDARAEAVNAMVGSIESGKRNKFLRYVYAMPGGKNKEFLFRLHQLRKESGGR